MPTQFLDAVRPHSLPAIGLTAVILALALSAGSALAETGAGDFLLRARGIAVLPNENASITVIGGGADIENTVVPEVDLTYFITDNIALEVIAAVTPHDVVATDTALGDVDLGEVWLLPPTATLQYHFDPNGQVSPYLGVGVNYTVFFNDDLPSGGAVTDIDYDNSVGLALQGGVDIVLNERWFLNLDVKKVWINTDVSLNGGAIEADVDIDPWIVGVGFGYRF